jgi:TctA family transporter
MIWGLQPGPLLFIEKADFVWGLIASMYLGNIVGLIVVLTCVPLFAAILRVPFSIIAPVILVICAIGAYTVHNSMFDVWLMLLFGVMGYVFKKLDYPLAPLVLALVLGDRARIRSGSRCCCRRATCASSSPTRWWAPSPRCRCCCSSGRLISKAIALLRGRTTTHLDKE